MRIESSDRGHSAKFKTKEESPDASLGFHSSVHLKNIALFDPNTTQTNALLHVKDNRFNLFLQQVYYSEKCSWFYIGLLVLSFGLILVTIFDCFQVAESPMFIVLEFVLNLLIGIDFGCRIKLVGCHKYVRDPQTARIRCWNIFDAVVVIFCNAVFAVSLLSKSGKIKGFEEAGEEALIVMWCIWQTLRMILIAKNQRQARQTAKALINFENLVVDTDFGGALSFRHSVIEGDRANLSGDTDEIVVEMATFGKDDDQENGKRLSDQNVARLRNKINTKPGLISVSVKQRFGRVNSGPTSGAMDSAANMNRYVIDDDDEDEDEDDNSSADKSQS